MTAPRKTTRARLTTLAAATLVAAGATGCVSQEKYDDLFETNLALTDRNEELRRMLDSAEARAGQFGQRGMTRDQMLNELQQQNGDLQATNAQLLADLRALESQIAGLAVAPLDPTTDRALAELADRYPNLIRYDAEEGRLRFASDLTFDSGRAEVKSGAMDSLRALAQVLNSTSASGYEIVIVGHTDAQRISSGTARRHPTNMHLSCHRAIAVRGELAKLGVANEKMQAAGWGEFRPLVPNTANGNTPANRRVEIYLIRARG